MTPSEDKKGPVPPPGGAGGEKKIFIQSDESWKEAARKEKDRLQEKAEKEEGLEEMPPPSFLGFVSDLGMQAMLALGLAEIRGAGGPRVDLPSARYTIDILDMLLEKTRGNLKHEEQAHLSTLVNNLHIAFVKVAKARAAEAGKIAEPDKKIIT